MFGWRQAAISLHNRHDPRRVFPNEHHAAAADLRRQARADPVKQEQTPVKHEQTPVKLELTPVKHEQQ